MATYIKKATLSWPDLWNELGLTKDTGGRWCAGANAPQFVRDYVASFRTPSRAWPMSHAKPLLTAKFAKHLTEVAPEIAVKCGVASA